MKTAPPNLRSGETPILRDAKLCFTPVPFRSILQPRDQGLTQCSCVMSSQQGTKAKFVSFVEMLRRCAL